MQPNPWAPDLLWPGHPHGTGCLSVRAIDTGFPTVVQRACLVLGLALLRPFLVWGFGLVRAQTWVFASPHLLLAGALGLCMLVRVAPVSRLFWLAFAVCVIGCELPRWWWVYEGRGVAPVPPLLAGAYGSCLGTGWDVTSPFLAGFLVCVCGQGSPPYPAIPGLVVWRVVRCGFPPTPACGGGSVSAGWCFPGWGV